MADTPEPSKKRPRAVRDGSKRIATLYDAVAGRVGYEGLLRKTLTSFSEGPTKRFIGAQISPDEVLFRRKNAPQRFVEDDIYDADRWLKPGQELPSSDLLKVIHEYVSGFYGRGLEGGERSLYSLDETALLAMGILLEEEVKERLGETGCLALTRPENDGQDRIMQ